jgi:hypothetical protein
MLLWRMAGTVAGCRRADHWGPWFLAGKPCINQIPHREDVTGVTKSSDLQLFNRDILNVFGDRDRIAHPARKAGHGRGAPGTCDRPGRA